MERTLMMKRKLFTSECNCQSKPYSTYSQSWRLTLLSSFKLKEKVTDQLCGQQTKNDVNLNKKSLNNIPVSFNLQIINYTTPEPDSSRLEITCTDDEVSLDITSVWYSCTIVCYTMLTITLIDD